LRFDQIIYLLLQFDPSLSPEYDGIIDIINVIKYRYGFYSQWLTSSTINCICKYPL